jgi:dipeptidyl aminopeptidase/acylaminoacyl peptidase
VLFHVDERRVEDVSAGFDLSPGELRWAERGRRLLFTADTRVYRDVFSYDLTTRRYTQLTRGRTIALGSVRDAGLAAFTMDSPTAPPDVHVSDLSFSSPRKLTTINPRAATFTLGETEVVTWKSDGHEIEGLLLKPVGFQKNTKYPLLVVAHGGPTGAYINNFRVGYGDGGQYWAGQGWAVLYPNPRGSTNYGETFTRANIGDWGGGDYRDIMAGVDEIVRRGVADEEKLAFMGWSYGGYLTAWAVATTKRFKAASVGAGMVPLALGSQTVGSVIRPASFCGAAACKPCRRKIPWTHWSAWRIVSCPAARVGDTPVAESSRKKDGTA